MALSATRATAQPPRQPNERDAWAEGILRQAHERASRASVSERAAYLQGLLGQQLTAIATGVADPRVVGQWARGERQPLGDEDRRLRETYEVATLLVDAESTQTAQAWFMGKNPHLDDRSPAVVFVADAEGGQRVLQAARAFLAHG